MSAIIYHRNKQRQSIYNQLHRFSATARSHTDLKFIKIQEKNDEVLRKSEYFEGRDLDRLR